MIKKIVVLACLATLISKPSFAGEWNFDVFGKAKSLYGYSNIDEKYKKDQSQHHLPSRFDASVLAQYKFNYEYEIGAYLDLQYGIDQELKDYNHGIWGEQAYLVFDAPFGKIIGGQSYNAAYQLGVGAPKIGVLGVNQSDIVNFVANPNWQRNNRGTSYRTLNSTEINTDGTAAKITYITPEIDDWMFGFSYVPNSYSRDGLISKHADYKNNSAYIFAAYYSTEWNNITISNSLGLAQFEDNDREASFGSSFYYKGWTLGGSARRSFVSDNDGKISKYNKDALVDFDSYRDAWAYNIGLGYEIGPFKTAVTYFYSKADGKKYEDKIIQFSNAYQYNKSLEIYAAVAHGEFAGRNQADSNEGYAFVTGLEFGF